MTVYSSIVFGILFAFLVGCQGPHPDDLTFREVPDDDEAMNAAMAKARETIGDFLSRLQNPETSKENLSLKASFEEDGQIEHLWLNTITYEDDIFTGTLGNNPVYVQGLTLGQRVSIPLERVSDWMDIEDGRLIGGYTIQVLRDKLPPKERLAFDEGLGLLVDEDNLARNVNENGKSGDSMSDKHGEIYWQAIEPIWEKISIYDGPAVFLEQFASVQAELGHLFAAHWCQSEVRNGGLHQFFYNPTGVLAPEAVAGFRVIGLADLGNIVEETMQFFGAPYPRERESRVDLLPEEPDEYEEEEDLFEELDSRFYEALNLETDRFERSADIYADNIASQQ